MNWSQNSTPVRKKLPCMSQMWTALFRVPRSNGPGRCQITIARLKPVTATQGRSRNPPAARTGRDQRPAMTCLVASFPSLPGRPSSSGCHGAPATISTGAANISSKCWITCTKK